MNKIPVGDTLAHAYGFATGSFLRLLGITWAPLVVMGALALMIQPGFMGNHMPLNDPDEVARQTLRLTPLLLVLTFLVRAMLANGITEEALGLRKGQTFVYFSIGAAVWRFIGAWLLVILSMIVIVVIMTVVFVVCAIAVGAAGGAAHVGSAIIGMMVVAGLLIFYGALIYIMARLTFFLPPVIVSEKKVDLARGWQLSHGNFWRIFLVGLGIFIPIIVVAMAIFIGFFGVVFLTDYENIFWAAVHGAKEEFIRPQIEVVGVHMRERAMQIWPYTSVINILFETFAYGLLYGAAAFAYKEVQPEPDLSITPG